MNIVKLWRPMDAEREPLLAVALAALILLPNGIAMAPYISAALLDSHFPQKVEPNLVPGLLLIGGVAAAWLAARMTPAGLRPRATGWAWLSAAALSIGLPATVPGALVAAGLLTGNDPAATFAALLVSTLAAAPIVIAGVARGVAPEEIGALVLAVPRAAAAYARAARKHGLWAAVAFGPNVLEIHPGGASAPLGRRGAKRVAALLKAVQKHCQRSGLVYSAHVGGGTPWVQVTDAASGTEAGSFECRDAALLLDVEASNDARAQALIAAGFRPHAALGMLRDEVIAPLAEGAL